MRSSRYWGAVFLLGVLAAIYHMVLVATDPGNRDVPYPALLGGITLLALVVLADTFPAHRLGAALAFLATVIGIEVTIPRHLWDAYAAAGDSLVLAAVLATTAWLTKPRCVRDTAVER